MCIEISSRSLCSLHIFQKAHESNTLELEGMVFTVQRPYSDVINYVPLFLYHHSELPNQAYKCCKMEQSIGTTILSSLWLAEYIQHLSFQIYSEISIIKRLNFRALLFLSHYRQFAHLYTSTALL